jgi:hypothetical protein
MTLNLLYLKSIECTDQNELSQDEPYLNFNGNKIWSGDMYQGDSVNLSHMDPLVFNDTASLSLWEEDNPGFPFYDNNDHLGTYTVTTADAPGGVFSVNYSGDGSYTLYMDVVSL